MDVKLDPDLQRAAAYLQASFPAAKLVAITQGLNQLAPMLWGHYEPERLDALRLVAEPISPCDPRTQSTASECAPGSRHADGGFVAEAAPPR